MTEPASPRVAPQAVSGAAGAQPPAWLFTAALGLILAAAAALRFYGLAWGAPYFHFHIDEHFVFIGAERLRVSMEAAARSGKFFMYSPLPMHTLNALVWVYEAVKGPLDLARFGDQVTYMVLGRAISATMGTATVLVTWFVGRKVAGRLAGLIAAALMATFVLHISETHSFRVDGMMLFFLALAWLFALRIAEEGRWPDYLWAGLFTGAAIGSKYSAAFVLAVIALAHLVSPRRPASWRDVRGWTEWTLRGASPLVVAILAFLVIDPMAVLYFDRFRQDINEQITSPLTGAVKPIWIAQFRDVQPQLYWFTTNLWWGMGPAMEIWGLAGVAWLLLRRSRMALVAAAFPVLYFLTAGGTIAPMARYILPLGPGLAVAAGALSAGLIAHRRWRPWAIAATMVVVGSTGLYAAAYMNVYASRDARLVASRYLWATVPAGSRILVEPAHSIPPTGTYLTSPDFHGDYVLWGRNAERHDYYTMYGLDTYAFLYRGGATDDEKRAYIESRLALVDYILMDDFYVQLYRHLPEPEHGVVKQYYRDLFDGKLGFELVKTFKVYPSLFGVSINDDGAELSSRMNDHPRIYLFKRSGR
jgi:4-amino-4-deoxy-L-arabinose transferase-like glycosyltransferase